MNSRPRRRLRPSRQTPAASPSAAPPAASGARGSRARDRLELDTTVVTGNRELPKVLYIVPVEEG